MKRIAIVLAGLLVIPLLAGPASAADKASRHYRAETSDGQTLRFGTVRDEDGRRRLNSVFFGEGFQLPCDDGTTLPYNGAGFSVWPWYFEGRTVTVEEWQEQSNFALHLVGTFRPATASGTFRYTVVFLNEDETARRCSTGDLTWTAKRLYWTPPTPR